MDIAARLIAFKDWTELSNSQFADQAGIPRPTLSQFLNGRNKRLSDDLTAKLHAAFPMLNVMWLLFGEGDMLTDPNIQFSEGKNGLFSAVSEGETLENEGSSAEGSDSESCAETDANQKNDTPDTDFGRQDATTAFNDHPAKSLNSAPYVPADPAKQIQSIMVFYSDNSFEIFTPSK